jgi:hypothetical protein
MTATTSNFEVIPTGEYLAQVTDIEDKEGNFGPQYQFSYEIVSPKPFAGKSKWGWYSQKLSGGTKPSKLWGVVQAIYNRPLVPGEAVDVDDLIGRQCIIVIVAEENDKGEEFSKITNVKAYKKQEPFPAAGLPKPDNTEFAAGEPEEIDDDPFADQ